jgi:nitroreductase
MDLIESLRTTGAVREFFPETVDDATLHRLLDTARFAPNGGNRQAWRVIVVKDPGARRALRDVYAAGMYEYLAISAAGLVPWAPVTDRNAEEEAITAAPAFAEQAKADVLAGGVPGLPEALHTAPVLLLVLADLSALAAIDRDLPRYTMIGGASIYPFVWSILLAARAEGLGGVITSVATRREEELRRLFSIPDTFAVAALVVLGRPVSPTRRLRRLSVEEFTWVDRFEGAALDGASGPTEGSHSVPGT